MRQVPAERLATDKQKWIYRVTREGKPELKLGARAALRRFGYPRYYLDFETIAFAVPIWKGTRPYEALPFQWSCHIDQHARSLEHREYLPNDDAAPMQDFVEALIEGVDRQGPIFTYSQYENRILADLIARFPKFKVPLKAITARLIDLLPLTRSNYYHPHMLGHWSIKDVLPTIAPELDYGTLDEVHDGGGAMLAYREMIAAQTTRERYNQLRKRLLEYCSRDTLATYKVAEFLQRG